MRGTGGQSKTVGSSDSSHGGDFRCGSLHVGQMFFANFLTNSYDNAFQPIIVPRPRATATATFTHAGMNLVASSMCFL